MRASYYDPLLQESVETDVGTGEVFDRVAGMVAQLKTERGTPTIELACNDGSTLAFSSDGERAFLVWTDTLGQSHHSVGGGYADELVFDYFGSWSEAPGEYLVSYADACVAVREFLTSGSPVTHSVLFSPD